MTPVSGDGEDPHATGFFYTDYSSDGVSDEHALELWDERLWLITNRHVVWNDDRGPTESLDICLRDPDYTFGFEKPAPEGRVHLDASYMAENVWIPGSHDNEPPDIAANRDCGRQAARCFRLGIPAHRGHSTIRQRRHYLVPSEAPVPASDACDDCGRRADCSTSRGTGDGDRLSSRRGRRGDRHPDRQVVISCDRRPRRVGRHERFQVDIDQFPGSSGSPMFTAPQPALSFDPDTGHSVHVVARPTLIGIHCAGREFKNDSVGLGIVWKSSLGDLHRHRSGASARRLLPSSTAGDS